MTDHPFALTAMTVDIVSSYVLKNRVTPDELPELVLGIHGALGALGTQKPPPIDYWKPPTKATIRKSITEAGLISFLNGKTYKSLKRHLRESGITPIEYRARFGLDDDYPIVAPSYSAKRSEIAKVIGLGRRQTGKSKLSQTKPRQPRKSKPV